MSNHYGFFISEGNNVQWSVQGAYLMSSTSDGGKHHLKGFGTYIHQSNIRQVIALYGARVLSKHKRG
jgi:hypothetical protein